MDLGVAPLVGVTLSHGSPEVEALNAWPLGLLFKTKHCGLGGSEPIAEVNTIWELTFSVIETVCGLLDAFGEVTVRFPVYVPGCRPLGSTLTDIVPGVDPLAGLVAIQFPPSLVTAATLKGAPAKLLDTEIDCAFGRAPPMSYAKDRDVGLAEIVRGGVLIVRLTLPVTGDCPEAVNVTVKCPAYVPFGMAPGITETVKLVPKIPTEPLDGVTVIQGASWLTEKLARVLLEMVQVPDGTELPV
jgi:hypothetical protein